MPKLTEGERQSINTRLELHQRLRESFKDRSYVSQTCRLCNWASNGLSFDEALAANREHEETHLEWLQIQATVIEPAELVRSIHDHDCVVATCACKSGCQSGPFCTLVFGPLCGTCLISANRGHSEHGEKG